MNIQKDAIMAEYIYIYIIIHIVLTLPWDMTHCVKSILLGKVSWNSGTIETLIFGNNAFIIKNICSYVPSCMRLNKFFAETWLAMVSQQYSFMCTEPYWWKLNTM